MFTVYRNLSSHVYCFCSPRVDENTTKWNCLALGLQELSFQLATMLRVDYVLLIRLISNYRTRVGWWVFVKVRATKVCSLKISQKDLQTWSQADYSGKHPCMVYIKYLQNNDKTVYCGLTIELTGCTWSFRGHIVYLGVKSIFLIN